MGEVMAVDARAHVSVGGVRMAAMRGVPRSLVM